MSKMKVTGGNLNVRKEPNTESEIIHVLADGEIINPAPEKDGWCAWGSGYVMARWLEPFAGQNEAAAPEAGEALQTAAKDIKEAAEDIKAFAKTVKKNSRSAKKTTGKEK